MPIEQIPSVWDYLAQGLGQGQQGYNFEQQLEDKRQQLAHQNAAENAGIMSQLVAAGMAPSSSMGPILTSAGMPNVPLMPSTAEKKNTILSQPGGLASASDEQLTGAGLPTHAQQDTANLAGAVAKSEMPNVGEMETVKRLGAMSPLMQASAQRYVGGLVARTGGIDQRTMPAITEQAFQQWKRDRAASGMPQIGDDNWARQFFQQAAYDSWITQEEMNIRRLAATNGRIGPRERQFGEMTQLYGQIRQEMNDMLGKIPGLAIFANMSDAQLNSDADGKKALSLYPSEISQYRQLQAASRGLTRALAENSRTQAPVDLTKFEGFGGGAPAAVTQPATPPAGDTPPTQTGTGAQPLTSEQKTNILTTFKQRGLNPAQIKATIEANASAGRITEADAAELKKAAGVPQ